MRRSLEMGGDEQARARQDYFECGRQASGRAAGAAGAGASADAGGRRRQAAPAAFSPGWFAAKGAARHEASGRLPDGSVAGIPTAARQQTQSRQQLQQSLGNLNRTAAAIAAQRAAQAAARQAAGNAARPVPDGWPAGGLQIDTQALTRGWTHAEAPKSSTENGRSTVTINQTADRAILNWQTFNVGRDTTVDFRQQAEWAVLNRVNDRPAVPARSRGRSRRRARC